LPDASRIGPASAARWACRPPPARGPRCAPTPRAGAPPARCRPPGAPRRSSCHGVPTICLVFRLPVNGRWRSARGLLAASAGGPAGQPGEAEVLRVGEQAGAVVLGAGGQGAETGEHETQARPEGPGPASGDHVVVAGARAPPG